MADQNTTIKINADTQQAVNNVAKLQQSMDMMSKRVMPSMGAAFGSLSGQLVSMQTGVSGFAGVLSMMGQGLMMVSPLMGAAAVGALALTSAMTKKKEAVKETTEALKWNDAALVALMKSNDSLTDILRNYQTTILGGLRAEEQTLAAKIAKLGFTEDELAAMEKLGFAHIRAAESEKFANEEIRKEFEATAVKLAAVRERIKALTEWEVEAGKKATDAASKLAAQRLAIDNAFTAMVANNQAEELAGQQALIEAELKLADVRTNAAFNSVAEGAAAYATMRQLTQEYYDFRLSLVSGNADAEATIELQRVAALEQLAQREMKMVENTTKAKNKLAKQSVDFAIMSYQVMGNAIQRAIQGQLAQHGGFAAFFVQTTGEAIQGVLKAYAALWAAEATANAITNPAVAATKAKAAAMAGVAVGIVGALTDAAVGAITKENEQAASADKALAGGGTDVSTRGGRTSVAAGPVNLYYNSTMVINGNVYDKGDLFDLMDQWNMNNMRTAGADAATRARG